MPNTAEQNAAYSQFSTSDYGRVGDQRPYQIVRPAYPAPMFLQRYNDLTKALQECNTLCALEGKPFRVVRWGRVGSGARGGVPCRACAAPNTTNRFPILVAEFRPNGECIVFGPGGCPRTVGGADYVVSASPAIAAAYTPAPMKLQYSQAVQAAQLLTERTGKRAYVCTDFNCGRSGSLFVPVVYVDPGGLAKLFNDTPTGTATVNTVNADHFKELVIRSQGGTLLGQGA